MKKLTLISVDAYKLRLSNSLAREVLRGIKKHPLEGEALTHMKSLEKAVETVEILLIITPITGTKK